MKIIFDTQSVRFENNMLYVNQTITVTEDIPANEELTVSCLLVCFVSEGTFYL